MYQNFDELKEACLQCRQCGLCETRHNVVFGVGNPHAKVMFVGEGPGENEDLQGEPFVGRAGKLLDTMLDAVDLSRQRNIYIANIVKCRPPQMPSAPEPRPPAGRTGGVHRLAAQPVCHYAPEDRGVSRQNRRHEADEPQYAHYQGTRAVYRQEGNADDGDTASRRPAAQSQPEARRVQRLPAAARQNHGGLPRNLRYVMRL